MSTMTPQEWLNKARWEGGIYDGFGYGLHASDLDDSDPGFKALVRTAESLANDYANAEAALLDYAAWHGYEAGE